MRWFRLLTLVAVFLCAEVAWAQFSNRSSHLPLDGNTSGEGLEDELARRLNILQNSQASQKLVEKFLRTEAGRKQFRELQQKMLEDDKFRKRILDRLSNDPDIRQQFQQTIEKNPALDGKTGEEWLDKLRGIGEPPQVPPDGGIGMPPIGVEPPMIQPGVDPVDPGGMPPGGNPGPMGTPPDGGTQMSPNTPEPKAKNWLEEQVQNRLGDWMETLGDEVGESDFFQTIAEELGESGFTWRWDDPSQGLGNGTLKKMADSLPKFDVSGATDKLASSLPSFGGVGSMPSMPGFSTPKVEVSTPNASVAAGATDLVMFVVWMVVLAMVGILLWKLREMFAGDGDGDGESDWQLGPWPIRPNAVNSRGDLVRAFEYLACLLLGKEALHWNHRELADRLGEYLPEWRDSADRLADLYEQARYTPDQTPLPAHDLERARQDLGRLAGVAG